MRSSPTHITKVGYPIGSFQGFKTLGIMSQADYLNTLKDREVYINNGNSFPAGYTLQGPAVADYSLEYLSPGNVIYDDYNGDNKITDADRQIIGNAYPDFTGGLNTSLSWNGFDLAMGFTYSMGARVVNFNDYYAYNMEGAITTSNDEFAYYIMWSPAYNQTLYVILKEGLELTPDQVLTGGFVVKYTHTDGNTYTANVHLNITKEQKEPEALQ
jgi:hypothetical protein